MEQAIDAMDAVVLSYGTPKHEVTAFIEAKNQLRAALEDPAPVQEPVAWWKQYPDGSISVVESRTFLAEDAVAMGWRALGFTDVAPRAPQPAPVQSDGWLQDGSLLYRLTAEKRPQNRDEINVTMADGSRTAEARTRRAGELLDRIRQRPAPPADVPMLSTQERLNIITQFTIAGTLGDLIVHVEKLVRQKAGLP